MLQGGGESGTEELGLGVGALLILLAMPGLLVSLLMFEKYGSLILWLRGAAGGDPFAGTSNDEYFFIVLTTTVTGAVALWCWDSIFANRRDHANLVHLPVPLHTVFLANFSAVLVLAALFAVVVNAASFILFPVAVVGSRVSFSVFLRFAAGHAVAVFFASIFSFFAVFSLAGFLMALLPAAAFRRVSLVARFIVAICLLALLASVFTVPDFLRHASVGTARKISMLPPVSILGLARVVWVNGRDPFAAVVAKNALQALAWTVLTAVLGYGVSFRRHFLRIPETADTGLLPRMRVSLSPLAPVHNLTMRDPALRSCYRFVARTILRSDSHLQVVSAFAAMGLVVAAEAITSIRADRFFGVRHSPSGDFLSVPFILSYLIIVGIRCAFEIPTNLDANWIFKFWLPPDDRQARSVARWVLVSFSMSWLVPLCFTVTFLYFGWPVALVHTMILVAASALLVEILLIHFRKIPFTCSYPAFQSNSGVILVAYLFGFFIFTSYFPEVELWALPHPLRTVALVPFFAGAFTAIYAYRKQILDMDKQLLFEDTTASLF
jgi:hypothetical protein